MATDAPEVIARIPALVHLAYFALLLSGLTAHVLFIRLYGKIKEQNDSPWKTGAALALFLFAVNLGEPFARIQVADYLAGSTGGGGSTGALFRHCEAADRRHR